MEKRNFAQRLKAAREAAGMSQAELEKETGIKREYISKLENNELKNPTLRTAQRLADGIGVLIETLVSDNVSPSQKLLSRNKFLESQVAQLYADNKEVLDVVWSNVQRLRQLDPDKNKGAT